MEVVTCRILRHQTLQQRTAVNVGVGGDIDQPRQHHFVHFRGGGPGRRLGDHVFKYVLLGNRFTFHDAQRLMRGKVARRLLLRRAGEALPGSGDKQRRWLAGIKGDGPNHDGIRDTLRFGIGKQGVHFLLERAVR